MIGVEGDSIVSRSINLPILCRRTILPSNPNEMMQEVTHIEKQVTAKEFYNRA